MYKVDVSKETIAQHDYKTAKVAGFKKLKELDLPDNFFGGRVHRIVVLKDSDKMLIIDELHNTIGVMEAEKKVDHIADAGKMVEAKIGGEIVEKLVEEVEQFREVTKMIEEVPFEEKKEMFACEKCGREFDSRLKLGTHKRFCKAGGDE